MKVEKNTLAFVEEKYYCGMGKLEDSLKLKN